MAAPDRAIRAMTHDHGFRVIAASTTHSVREVVARQAATGLVAKAVSDLVTAAVLLRETMSPNLRVQALLRGAGGKGSLVGDSFPDGPVRGLAQVRKGTDLSLGHGSMIQMMRTLPNGGVQQGIVDVGQAGGIGEALTVYFQESEQVVSVARIATRFDGDTLVAAGGFVVQLLPEAERPLHAIMTQRLSDFPSMESFLAQEGFSADLLMSELVYGMAHTELGRQELRFHCRCDETLVLSALSSLSKEDVQSMVDDGEGLEIHCDYCGKDYAIAVERLRALLAQS
ncbi:MAG: Hsp33 family molecular chaperone HslO [Myxococcales bacterium]|nr:Hsp33 family molecular chaperone HslO [Myxococcales bacterium]